jgi:hypothetical protein
MSHKTLEMTVSDGECSWSEIDGCLECFGRSQVTCVYHGEIQVKLETFTITSTKVSKQER